MLVRVPELPTVTRLHRPFASKMRMRGLVEFFSTFVLLCVLLGSAAGVVEHVGWGSPSDSVGLIAIAAVGVAVRAVVWTEYVESDGVELRWRSLLRTGNCGWNHVAAVEVARMALFPNVVGPMVLQLRFVNGSKRKLRCTAGCRNTWPSWLAAIEGRVV